ncbi:MAG TPA: beta-propeller fold lactonase family protein, partial [Mycobacterium sp.]|nr:beta-propeller fold lactonase family protein [Mycobacterium sp.]
MTTQSGGDTSDGQSATAPATPAQPTSQPTPPPAPPPAASVVDVAPAPINVAPVPQVESAPESDVTPLTANLLSAVGLAPSADGDTPEVPGESPLLLAGLAAFRRQTQQGSVEDAAFAKTAADPSQSSLMMAAAANSAPTVDPLVGSPDQATGAVQVSLHASDADGNPLSYAVTGAPTGGSVEALGNGEFRYTPTVASRLAAATTSTPDFDSFTVSVSDGQGGVTPVSITVPKLPAVWANQVSASNVTGASPAGVAMVGDLAYVANQGTNTVTVVNTKTGAVVGNPIVVGTAPTGVLANANGTRVYVTNRTSGTVSVIRTSDNTVIGSVKVGTSPESMAFNSAGTRLYVANYGSSDVSVVDISGPSPTLITNVAVGAYPRGLAFATVNGQQRVYVTRYTSSSVAVIDATTNKQIDVNPATTTVDSIKVGANPQAITVSADGTRAYVINYGSNSVSVINTATNTVDGAAISVGTKPAGVALSGDGSLLYVANGNDTVSVINTKTRALVATLQIDSAPETNYHTLAVRSDGSLVVTDMADKAVRVVALKRGNTAPVAISAPGVGDANPNNGAISGPVNIKDWDGDALTYSAVVAPTKGTLTFDATAGTYTYIPTQAARDAAAQTPATDRFTIRATDPSGAYKDTASVTVQILPTPSSPSIPVTVTPIAVTTSPSAVAVSGNAAYVYGGDVISTINTSTNTVTDQTALYNDPPAITSDGRMYVPNPNLYYQGNAPYDSVDVINTATGAVIKNIPLPICNDCAYANPSGPRDVVISPDGQRVYVSEDYYLETGIATTVVHIIDTRTDTVTGYYPTSPLSDMEIASDGTIYAASAEYPFVNVYNANMSQTGSFSLTSLGYYYWSPTTALALNGDKTRGYVVVQDYGYGQHVAVIDTAPGSATRSTELAVITERSSALSPDGSRRYDARSDGKTVDVYDTGSNALIGSFATDQNAGSGPRSIAVANNGTVYVTDMSDNKVYAVTVGGGTQSVQSFAAPPQAKMMLAPMGPTGGESMLMAAAAANSAPTVSPAVGLPETVNGVVTGSLNAVDPDGNPLTYTVQSQSAGAAVTVNGAGNFTYTPSVSQRLQASSTSGLDTDTFTLRVSDGQTFTDVPVTVVVRPGQFTGSTPVDVDRDPSGVAFSADGSRAYVTNKYDKSVSVVNTSTGTVLATIKVPYGPNAVVVSPVAGQNRAYVAMTTGVAVIDTATNKLVDVNPATTTVDSIKVGASPSALAINSTGTRLYVSNLGSTTVSVINTATNTEIARVTVGSQPSGLVVSPDDSRVYALSRYSDKVTVFSAATNQVIGSAAVGDSPRGIVLSPNGQVAYVTNYNSGTVTVLNTTANTPVFVKTITVGTQPEGIAISKDGALVYVANGKDTLSVIDTRTNTVVGSPVAIDSPAESGAHAIAVSGNRIYVTDYVDDYVRVLNLSRTQTAPQADGSPTVSTPDATNGTVTGDLKVVDTDGDALSYSVFAAPTKGALTVSPKGIYTYTPTAAARAAATQGSADTFTVRVSDSLGAYKDVSVTVPILSSTNRAPVVTGTPFWSSPDWTTGQVTGGATFTDPDGNPLSYTVVNGPTKGTITLRQIGTMTAFTYTPTLAARNTAYQTQGDDTDSFTIVASDGQASASVPFTVTVAPLSPVNHAPALQQGSPQMSVDLYSGQVYGTFTVSEPDGDQVSYSYGSGPDGDVSLYGSSGPATTYTYTFYYRPTDAARQRAAQTPGADTTGFDVTVSDGRGGVTSFSIQVPLEPRPTDMPVWRGPTTTTYDPYSGRTTGNMNVVDPDNDPLTYGTTYGPWYGTLTIDNATGNYVYVPYLNADQGV